MTHIRITKGFFLIKYYTYSSNYINKNQINIELSVEKRMIIFCRNAILSLQQFQKSVSRKHFTFCTYTSYILTVREKTSETVKNFYLWVIRINIAILQVATYNKRKPHNHRVKPFELRVKLHGQLYSIISVVEFVGKI